MERGTLLRHGRDLCGIVLGSAVNAAGTTYFLTGCDLVPGGVAGVGHIINKLSGFPIGGAVFIISGLILVAGLIFYGKESFAKTLFCIAVFSSLLELAHRILPKYTGNLLLGALLGGAFIGLGLGLILRCRGSLGTTDLIAQILNKYFGISVSGAILVMDVIPMVVGALLFGGATLIYSVLCLVIITQVIGLTQPKKTKEKQAE
jgi:Uncharacterized conserved protein